MTLDPNAAGKGPGYGLMLGGVGLLFGSMILAAGIRGALPWWQVAIGEVAVCAVVGWRLWTADWAVKR